jgi:hypothetical protein
MADPQSLKLKKPQTARSGASLLKVRDIWVTVWLLAERVGARYNDDRKRRWASGRSPGSEPSLEGMRGKHLEGQCTAVPILSAGSSRRWSEGRPRQAPHQANSLADDPGKGRHSESVRGMEGKNISIPRRVLRPCHLSTDWLPFAPLQQEPKSPLPLPSCAAILSSCHQKSPVIST